MKKLLLFILISTSPVLFNQVNGATEISKIIVPSIENVITVHVTNNSHAIVGAVVKATQNGQELGKSIANADGDAMLSLKQHNGKPFDIEASAEGFQTIKMTGVLLGNQRNFNLNLQKHIEGMPLISVVAANNTVEKILEKSEEAIKDTETKLTQNKEKDEMEETTKNKADAIRDLEQRQAEIAAVEEAEKMKKKAEKEAQANQKEIDKAQKKQEAQAKAEAKKAKAAARYSTTTAKFKAKQNKIDRSRNKLAKTQQKLDKRISSGKIDVQKAKDQQIKIDRSSLKLDVAQQKLEGKKNKAEKAYTRSKKK